jgi:hypothetical protein
MMVHPRHLMTCSTLIMQKMVAPFRLWPSYIYIYWIMYLVVDGGQMMITRLSITDKILWVGHVFTIKIHFYIYEYDTVHKWAG